MRFRDLPSGAPFRYQGEDYIKTGPLAATPRSGGNERLIARSAVVDLPSAITPPPTQVPIGIADAAAVRAALAALHDAAQQQLLAAGSSAADRQALTALRDQWLRQLGLAP